MPNMLCINAGGKGDLHGVRARLLTRDLPLDVTYVDFDRQVSRWQTIREVWQILNSQSWDLVYQESSGIAGGINLIRAARSWGQRYLISTGDPVGGFFRTTKGLLWGNAMESYERLLYQNCAGFIGWTPYLTGMALKMGAKRAITVEGGADLTQFYPLDAVKRSHLKEQWQIPSDHLICGVVGSLKWTPRQQYCYGLELVETLKFLQREDMTFLIVGDGDGKAQLEQRVPPHLKHRVIFTGRVPMAEVAQAINLLDIGFITQTLDGLGNYRLTTKLPEYLACGVPVAMSPVPGFYDYATLAGWALPPYHPASDTFHRACAQWLDALTPEVIQLKAIQARPLAEKLFDYDILSLRFKQFIIDLLA
jgi:hypothetical protein